MIKVYYGTTVGDKAEKLIAQAVIGAGEKRRQIFIVPETATFQTEQKLLSSFPSGANPWVEVYSASRLATMIVERAGVSSFIDDGGKILIAKSAVDATCSSFKYYTKGINKGAFYSKMLELFEEMATSGLKAEELYSAYENGGLGENILDIASAYTVYSERVREQGEDKKNLLKIAAEHMDRLDILQGADLYLYGFTGFSYNERVFIESLMSRCSTLTFAVVTDGRDSLFSEQNKTINFFEQLAHRLRVGFQRVELKEPSTRPPELDHLSGNIYGFSAEKYQETAPSLEFIEADSMEQECQFVMHRIRQLASERGFKYGEVAIVTGGVEEYRSTLLRCGKAYNLPIYIADKSDLLTKPVMAACLGVLSAIKNSFSYESMFAFLKTDIFNIPHRLCDLLENYVIAFNISGNGWCSPWERPLVDFGVTPTDQDMLELMELNALRERLMEPILKLKEQMKAAQVGEDYVKAFLGYLDQVGFEARIEAQISMYYDMGMYKECNVYAQLYSLLIEGLEQFLAVSKKEQMSADQYIELLCLVLSTYSVSTIPATTHEVVVSDFRELTWHGAKAVFVVGCSDSFMPPIGGGSSLVSETDREGLRKEGVELSLTGEERQNELESHIYRTLATPSHILVLSYSSIGDGSGQSYLYQRGKKLFEQPVVTQVSQQREEHLLHSKEEVMCLAYRYVGGDTSAAARGAYEYTLANKVNDQLAAVKEYSQAPRGPVADKGLVKKLYGERITMSASRIEKVNTCPFSYLMEYGFRAKPRTRIKFDSRAVGNFIHMLIERVIGDYIKCPDLDVAQAISGYTLEYVTELTKARQINSRLQVLIQSIAKEAHLLVADMIEEIKSSDFKPMYCEFSFGKGGDAPAMSLDCGEITVEVNGKIDRVDGYIKGDLLYIKVVDYKSGKKAFRLSDLYYGLNIQMFLYLMMIKNSNLAAQHNAGGVEAGAVLYVPVGMEYESGHQDDPDSEGVQTRKGYVLEDLDIVEALEHSEDGKFRFLPIGIKKDGQFTARSCLLNTVEFGKLFKKLTYDLNRIAKSVTNGEIEAKPYKTGIDTTACDWCNFHMACQFDESTGKDSMRQVVAMSKEQMFEKMAQEVDDSGC